MSRYPLFDRRRLRLRSLQDRGHDLTWSDCLPLQPPREPIEHPGFPDFLACVRRARRENRPVILMMGAHPIKLGLSRYLVDLPANYRDGPPTKDHPLYNYRPWKTILVRTVADGGTSFYFRGDHRQTIPSLWHGVVGCQAE